MNLSIRLPTELNQLTLRATSRRLKAQGWSLTMNSLKRSVICHNNLARAPMELLINWTREHNWKKKEDTSLVSWRVLLSATNFMKRRHTIHPLKLRKVKKQAKGFKISKIFTKLSIASIPRFRLTVWRSKSFTVILSLMRNNDRSINDELGPVDEIDKYH